MYHGGSNLMRLLIMSCVLAVAMAPSLPAQDEQTKPVASSATSITELPFEVYLRKTQDGELVLVPDFSLEEYLRLYNESTQQPQVRSSDFVISKLEINGEVKGVRAELEVRYEIERSAAKEGESVALNWIPIPLRLGQAVFLEKPKYEGSGEQFERF